MRVWDLRDISQPESQRALEEAAAALRAGGLIAFPTETVYGLGANACDDSAVRRVFAAKGRPADNPLIVHIASLEQLDQVVAPGAHIPEAARRAMNAFWPGPVTLLLPAHPDLAPAVHPGLDTVGVRMPAHPVARALIERADCPVAAPSANRSGRPSPTTAADVREDLEGRIDGVIDGGPCTVGVESTVVAVAEDRAVIYRPGGITPEQLEAVMQIPVELDAHLRDPGARPQAPGMKYRHYAPDTPVHVWWGNGDRVAAALRAFAAQHPGERLGVLAPPEIAQELNAGGAEMTVWTPDGAEPYARALARELYGRLRWLDRQGVRHILVVGVPPVGEGLAVMNRLAKAAEGRVQQV